MIASEMIPFDGDVRDHRVTDPAVLGFRQVLPRVDFVWRPPTQDPNRPCAVEPRPIHVELSLNPVEFPGEQRQTLPDPQRLEEPLDLPVELARPLPPLHQRDALLLDQAPEPRPELASLIGDQETRRAEFRQTRLRQSPDIHRRRRVTKDAQSQEPPRKPVQNVGSKNSSIASQIRGNP